MLSVVDAVTTSKPIVAITVSKPVVTVTTSKPKPALVAKKFFCQCLLEDDTEVFLVIRATSEAHASKLAHDGYSIAYVLDIISPLQMEYRKRHLRPSIMTGQPLN